MPQICCRGKHKAAVAHLYRLAAYLRVARRAEAYPDAAPLPVEILFR